MCVLSFMTSVTPPGSRRARGGTTPAPAPPPRCPRREAATGSGGGARRKELAVAKAPTRPSHGPPPIQGTSSRGATREGSKSPRPARCTTRSARLSPSPPYQEDCRRRRKVERLRCPPVAAEREQIRFEHHHRHCHHHRHRRRHPHHQTCYASHYDMRQAIPYITYKYSIQIITREYTRAPYVFPSVSASSSSSFVMYSEDKSE